MGEHGLVKGGNKGWVVVLVKSGWMDSMNINVVVVIFMHDHAYE